jgi:ElaA protein
MQTVPDTAKPSVAWAWKRFADLAGAELYAVLAARAAVFIVEQSCAFQDVDGFDPYAWHLLGWTGPERDRTLCAYLRLIEPGRKYREPSIGRVLTTGAFRGLGFGREAMREGLARAAELYPGLAVRIAAQQRLERFYATMGFSIASEPYEEDGILHVDMVRAADGKMR